MVQQLFSELAALPQIEAIALGGSRAGAHYDEKSDYDVYLYCRTPVDVNIRRIRMKIEDEPSNPKFISTIWGFGYKWSVKGED